MLHLLVCFDSPLVLRRNRWSEAEKKNMWPILAANVALLVHSFGEWPITQPCGACLQPRTASPIHPLTVGPTRWPPSSPPWSSRSSATGCCRCSGTSALTAFRWKQTAKPATDAHEIATAWKSPEVPHSKVLQKQKLRPPLLRIGNYQRFALLKPGARLSIALNAMPAARNFCLSNPPQ